MLHYGMKTKGSKKKKFTGVPSSQWFRDEIAIMQGRKSFTPDVTMAKGPVNLGPIANSVVQDGI